MPLETDSGFLRRCEQKHLFTLRVRFWFPSVSVNTGLYRTSERPLLDLRDRLLVSFSQCEHRPVLTHDHGLGLPSISVSYSCFSTMPFARTLRIRASRHRTQKSSSGCACRSASSVRPSAGVSGGTGSSVVAGGGGGDGGAGRQRGTTLGYVKSTWAELVARSERPVLGGSGSGSGPLPGSGGQCVGRLGSHVRRRASPW